MADKNKLTDDEMHTLEGFARAAGISYWDRYDFITHVEKKIRTPLIEIVREELSKIESYDPQLFTKHGVQLPKDLPTFIFEKYINQGPEVVRDATNSAKTKIKLIGIATTNTDGEFRKMLIDEGMKGLRRILDGNYGKNL